MSEVFEKLAKWRASPKIGQEGQVDEKHGWRNPVQLREDEVDVILTLREAVAPQMAEVDEMVRQIKSYPHVNSYEGAMKLASMLCTVILTCEREKHRADELESRYSRFMRRL